MAQWLFVGQIHTGWVNTAQMRLQALRDAGHDVAEVCNVAYGRYGGRWGGYLFRKLRCGPPLSSLNQAVLDAAEGCRPDFVWIDKGDWIRSETVITLRKRHGCAVVHYTPDPAFTTVHRSRHLRRAIRHYDLVLTTKTYELDQYRSLGAPRLFNLLPTFDQRLHHPVSLDDIERDRFGCDVVFIGTYELGREKYLLPLVRAGLDVAIWGSYWRDRCRNMELRGSVRGSAVSGPEYVKALCGGKLGLGLLNKLHPDRITTRSVEIPATGTLLLAERTEEHSDLFQDREEAVLFADEKELLTMAVSLLQDDEMRRRIADAGRRRVLESRCDVRQQMNDILAKLGGIARGNCKWKCDKSDMPR